MSENGDQRRLTGKGFPILPHLVGLSSCCCYKPSPSLSSQVIGLVLEQKAGQQLQEVLE